MLANTFGFISLSQLAERIRANLHRIPRDLDFVVGIPRSGMIPAYAIGLYLNLPVLDIAAFASGRAPQHGFRPLAGKESQMLKAQRILLVDDSYFVGNAMRKAITTIREAGYAGEIVTCVAVVLSDARRDIDIHFMEMEPPRVFEWNLFHHGIIEQACLDFDGVLCVDPTDAENDDGVEYRKFLKSARPLHLPSVTVGHIVSARLEKYRPECEDWLARYNVKYRHLHLLDLPSGEERRRAKAHCTHKIRVYRETHAPLFIESDDWQAQEIAQQTGWPVLSLAGMQMHRGHGLYPANLAANVRRVKSNLKTSVKLSLSPLMLKRARQIRAGIRRISGRGGGGGGNGSINL